MFTCQSMEAVVLEETGEDGGHSNYHDNHEHDAIIRITTFSIIAKGVTTVSTQSTGTATKIVQNARCPVHQKDGGDHGGKEVTCNVYYTYFGSNPDGLAYILLKNHDDDDLSNFENYFDDTSRRRERLVVPHAKERPIYDATYRYPTDFDNVYHNQVSWWLPILILCFIQLLITIIIILLNICSQVKLPWHCDMLDTLSFFSTIMTIIMIITVVNHMASEHSGAYCGEAQHTRGLDQVNWWWLWGDWCS